MLLAVLSSLAAFAGVGQYRESDEIRINEICTANLKSYISPEGEAPDWIELYNAGERDVDLSGYVLSKTNGKKNSFVFPKAVIKGGGYLIVPLGEEQEEVVDPDASFSLTSFLLTGKAVPVEKKLACEFTLSSEGDQLFLFDRAGTRLDQVDIPALFADTSYARGSQGWIVSEPTPGEENSGIIAQVPSLETPRFSLESGFYEGAHSLELFSLSDADIYYTTDGSTPGPDDLKYTGPILLTDISETQNRLSDRTDISPGYELSYFDRPKDPVPKATVIRAVCYDREGSFSQTASASYFIDFANKEGFQGFPIVSLICDPDDFFGSENGIYVLGAEYEKYRKELLAGKAVEADPWVWIPANYLCRGPLYEREIYIEYFDENRRRSAAQRAGARIKGNSSRGLAEKSLNLYARGAYGKRSFEPPLAPGNTEKSGITLYSGAQDTEIKLQDLLGSALLSDKEVATMESNPCQVFLNGEYWGLYLITEKYDAAFVSEHYAIPEEEAVIIKSEELICGTEADLLEYERFKDFARNSDFSEEANYERFKELVDIDSFLNYYCAEIFFGHETDWPIYNTACFKSREAVPGGGKYRDGRWRYMLYDVNGLMQLENIASNTVESALSIDFALPKLLESSEFRRDFSERMRTFIERDLATERIDALIDELAEEIRPGITVYYDRYFSGQGRDLSYFEEKLEELKRFFHERGAYILPYVEEACK